MKLGITNETERETTGKSTAAARLCLPCLAFLTSTCYVPAFTALFAGLWCCLPRSRTPARRQPPLRIHRRHVDSDHFVRPYACVHKAIRLFRGKNPHHSPASQTSPVLLCPAYSSTNRTRSSRSQGSLTGERAHLTPSGVCNQQRRRPPSVYSVTY